MSGFDRTSFVCAQLPVVVVVVAGFPRLWSLSLSLSIRIRIRPTLEYVICRSYSRRTAKFSRRVPSRNLNSLARIVNRSKESVHCHCPVRAAALRDLLSLSPASRFNGLIKTALPPPYSALPQWLIQFSVYADFYMKCASWIIHKFVRVRCSLMAVPRTDFKSLVIFYWFNLYDFAVKLIFYFSQNGKNVSRRKVLNESTFTINKYII